MSRSVGREMQTMLAIVAVAGSVVLDVVATRVIVATGELERGQKIAQLVLVWFIPVLGASVVLAVHRALSHQAPTHPDFPRSISDGQAVDFGIAADDPSHHVGGGGVDQ